MAAVLSAGNACNGQQSSRGSPAGLDASGPVDGAVGEETAATDTGVADGLAPIDASAVIAADTGADAVPAASEAGPVVLFDGGCVPFGAPFVNTSLDPHNCGAIGNDCDGGACDDGGCVALDPSAIATGQQGPVAIAADDVNVYWVVFGSGVILEPAGVPPQPAPVVESSGGQVLSCAVTGCNNRPTILAADPSAGQFLPNPTLLTTDGSHVYWTDDSTVESCAVGGCRCAPQALATGLNQPTSVIASADRIYWTEWAHGSPNTGTVSSCPIGGCIGPPDVLATNLGGPLGIAVDTSGVYWVDTYDARTLMRCAIGGCNGDPETLASDAGLQSTAVTTDGTNVYWTSPGTNAVMQCAKGNCSGTLVALATNQTEASGIAVDESSVYWRTDSVYKCAIGGCNGTPTLVASSGPGSAQWDAALAINKTHVFWTEARENGDIWIRTAPK